MPAPAEWSARSTRHSLSRSCFSTSMEGNRWPLRGLGLKVLDLPSEVAYYERLGLRLLESDTDRALLGFEDSQVLNLRRLEAGKPRPRRSAGLYHFALLLPDAPWLGQVPLRRAD